MDSYYYKIHIIKIKNVLQPATSHLLPNKAFVSMIKMLNPVLLIMIGTNFNFQTLLATLDTRTSKFGCFTKKVTPVQTSPSIICTSLNCSEVVLKNSIPHSAQSSD